MCRRGVLPCVGSPPRARGAVSRPSSAGIPGGITPACAGSSELYNENKEHIGDHPRVRGEQAIQKNDVEQNTGSPPRARGAVAPLAPSMAALWITPACAGSRDSSRERGLPDEDHPRVRGEQKTITSTASSGSGSPPRARGAARSHRSPWQVWVQRDAGPWCSAPRPCGRSVSGG